MNTEQLKALENIKRAIGVNDGDTLSHLARDDKVLWTASGSWAGPENVTLGDLRAIAAIAPPVAAGSVDTLQRYELVEIQHGTGYMVHWDKAMEEDADGEWVKHVDVNAWAAQHVANAIKDQMERAEKAESERDESRKWHSKLERTVIEYDDKLKAAEARVKELEEDAMRWRYLRDLDHDLTGTAGQPCVALPNGMNSGYYLTGPEAIYAVDMSMAEAAQK